MAENTEYTAAVRAVNSIGESDASDSVTFTTTAAATVVTGYQVQIYDKNYKNDIGDDGTLSRTLTQAVSIRIQRDLNRPEMITFQVPIGTDDADAIELGKVVRILDGADVIASGVIVGNLDKTRTLIPVTASGKSILLSFSITPWDFKLESSTAADQITELLTNYRFFRQNTEDDFNAGTFSDHRSDICGSFDCGNQLFRNPHTNRRGLRRQAARSYHNRSCSLTISLAILPTSHVSDMLHS